MKNAFVPIALIAALGACTYAPVPQSTLTPQAIVEQKVSGAGSVAGDRFGVSSDTDGTTVVVGAMNTPATTREAAYVFEKVNGLWTELVRFEPTTGTRDEYGRAVAVDGAWLAVSAPRDDTAKLNGGAVYMYQRSAPGSWVLHSKLVSTDSQPNDLFGYSLDLDGPRLIVGALQDDDGADRGGSAYIFDYSGSSWQQTAELVAADALYFDEAGYSVALDGDAAVVGAWRRDEGVVDSGAAYVFRQQGAGWTQEAKLTHSGANVGDFFGWDVAINDGRILVGASTFNGAATNAGAAYVFEAGAGGWQLEQRLMPSSLGAQDLFGSAVALEGDKAFVTSLLDDDAATDAGAVYSFELGQTAWDLTEVVRASDAEANYRYGESLAYANGVMVAGTKQDDSERGAAYVRSFFAPGQLDPQFGQNGLVATNFGGGDRAEALVVDHEGRIVLGGRGHTANDGFSQFAVARYLDDGSLDPSFGNGGKVLTNNGYATYGNEIIEDNQERLIIAGVVRGGSVDDVALTRFLENGSLDPSFGSGGKVSTNFNEGDGAYALGVDAQGCVLVGGNVQHIVDYQRRTKLLLARYLDNGNLDLNFAQNGAFTLDLPDSVGEYVEDLVVDSQGKVTLVAGGAFGSVVLVRVTSTGSLDTTFGQGGILTFTHGVASGAEAIILDNEGRYVVTGHVRTGIYGGEILAIRFNPSGTLDPSFGNGAGFVVVDLNPLQSENARAVVQASDGGYVLAGQLYSANTEDFALVRLNPNGTHDGSFGTGGYVATDFGGSEVAYGVGFDNSGKVVAGGARRIINQDDFMLARYFY